MCLVSRLQAWQVCRRQVAVELLGNDTLEKLGHHRLVGEIDVDVVDVLPVVVVVVVVVVVAILCNSAHS